MNKSDSIKGLGQALLTFHKEVGKVAKESSNPFFRSKYASLPQIQEAIKEPLEKAGLVYSQFPDGQNGLTSILIHADSGEWIEATYTMTPAKNDPQGQGSAITYQRRYALSSILGLTVDEDDDGNAASTAPKKIPNTKVDYPEAKDADIKPEDIPF